MKKNYTDRIKNKYKCYIWTGEEKVNIGENFDGQNSFLITIDNKYRNYIFYIISILTGMLIGYFNLSFILSIVITILLVTIAYFSLLLSFQNKFHLNVYEKIIQYYNEIQLKKFFNKIAIVKYGSNNRIDVYIVTPNTSIISISFLKLDKYLAIHTYNKFQNSFYSEQIIGVDKFEKSKFNKLFDMEMKDIETLLNKVIEPNYILLDMNEKALLGELSEFNLNSIINQLYKEVDNYGN